MHVSERLEANGSLGMFLCEDADLCSRVRAEFREMPGLRLTVAQAARLFSLEPARCERVLRALIEAGILTTDGCAYAPADAGRGRV